ncbi:Chaoptin [Danaus plexippus plexippus]|uniref:Chaoptin n=2 Tax=Danaus plexippus TaxID=13037 RepID=A0A212EM10_DANPL|nr:Chaoptin [Danaus plexippus plexippus]
MLTNLETQIKTIAFDENPLTCNCESQDLWKWTQDHLKIVLEGSRNLRCEYPEELHGVSFIELTSQKLCDIPIIKRLAIQDIQTYSVLVSWQSRNQSGLNGYQVAYYKEQTPNVIRGKVLNATARTTRLSHLTPGARYNICVLALGDFGNIATSALYGKTTTSFTEHSGVNLYGDEQVFTNLRSYMNNTHTSKCTSVTTIEIFSAALDSPFSNTYMGITELLTRRLSLVVGGCIGLIVFIVLVSVLGYMKTKKRPPLPKTEVQQPPQYISYDNFTATNIDVQSTDIDINTISNNTPTPFKQCE